MELVLISSESRYPIRRKRLTSTITKYLIDKKLEDVEVSVTVVGSRKIQALNKKWRNLDEPTTVLTFGLEEPRDQLGILRLGDIVISYPGAREIAQDRNVTMDEAIDILVIHGLNNLICPEQNQNADEPKLFSHISPQNLFGTG